MPLIPILLELFSFSGLLLLLFTERVSHADDKKQTWTALLKGFADTTKQRRINLPRSSLVGYIVGVIPGAGATISSFLAYGIAKQQAKKPEKFGEGLSEVLVASDTANNATTCGAVIPMLESNSLRATRINGVQALFESNISIALFILVVLSILGLLFRK